jgi:Ribbon-helix-helix protein, copG family.
MTSAVQIKISEEVYNKVKEIAEKSGKSIREVVEEAINIYLLGKSKAVSKDIVKHRQSWIVARHEDECEVCKRKVEAGTRVYWMFFEYSDGKKHSTVICPECYYSQIDVALAKRYLKVKELEATIRGLKKEADRLAEEVRLYEQRVNILKLEKEIEEFWYSFRTAFTNDPSVTTVREFLNRFEDLINKARELEAFASINQGEKLKKRSWSKQSESLIYNSA